MEEACGCRRLSSWAAFVYTFRRPITLMKKSTTRGLIVALIVPAIIVVGAITVSQFNEVADEPGPASTQ